MKKFLISVYAIIIMLSCAPAGADTIYSNGPISGAINALSFVDGFYTVADSFVSSGPATVTGFSAGLWVFTGDIPTTVTWTILTGGPSFLGGSTVASAAATWSNVLVGPNTGPPSIVGVYDVYSSIVTGLSVSIGPGTYWLELTSGATEQGRAIQWDENDGPAVAYQHLFTGDTLSRGSESFTLYGTPVPIPPSALLLGSGLMPLAWFRRRKRCGK